MVNKDLKILRESLEKTKKDCLNTGQPFWLKKVLEAIVFRGDLEWTDEIQNKNCSPSSVFYV